MPQAHGGALLPGGVEGNKGGTGRPRNEFRQMCRDLLADPATIAAIKRAAQDETTKGFAPLLKQLTDRAFGPVEKKVKHTGSVDLIHLLAEAHRRKRAETT